MNVEVNRINYYNHSELNDFNSLFSFLNEKSSMSNFGVNFIYKIGKSFWKFSYKNGDVKYYKFIYQGLYNNDNDIKHLKNNLKKDELTVSFTDRYDSCEDIIKEIFNMNDEVFFVEKKTHSILRWKLNKTKECLDILRGKLPYIRSAYDMHLEHPDVSKLVDDDIEKLEMYIKIQEEYLAKKKDELQALYMKRSGVKQTENN